MDPKDIIKNEEAMMGRSCKLINAHSTVVDETEIMTVIYETIGDGGFIEDKRMREIRVVTVTSERQLGSHIVLTEWIKDSDDNYE